MTTDGGYVERELAMNTKETNFLAPTLSAIASLGAIVAALSLLFSHIKISKPFIDNYVSFVDSNSGNILENHKQESRYSLADIEDQLYLRRQIDYTDE